MSTRQQGTALTPEGGFPFGKSFAVEISSGNYPNKATLVLTDEQGTPVVRYRVGSKKGTVLDQIVAIVPAAGGQVKFQFSLNPATPAQVTEGYISGTYTFLFTPPGTNVTIFDGALSDPRKGPTGEDDEWTAKGGGGDDSEY